MTSQSDVQFPTHRQTSHRETSQPLTSPGESRRKWKRVFSILAAIGSIPVLLLFVFSLLGDYFFLAELIGNFRFQILVLILPVFLLLLYFRRKKLAILFAIALAWASVGTLSVYLPAWQTAPGTEQMRILSFNLLGSNFEFESVLDEVSKIDPDVIVLLEYSTHWHDAFSNIADKYPYKVLEPRWHGFGIAMYSKRPLQSIEIHRLTRTETDNPTISATIEVDDQQVRLIGVHTLSPTNRFRMELRNKQLKELGALVQASDLPTVVVGDFNCTPWSPFLSRFLRATRLRDSRQGFGFQASWHAGKWPVSIPIDHALVSRQIHVHNRFLGEPAGSDHLPLIVDMSVHETQ